jgi:hypothetical protein
MSQMKVLLVVVIKFVIYVGSFSAIRWAFTSHLRLFGESLFEYILVEKFVANWPVTSLR